MGFEGTMTGGSLGLRGSYGSLQSSTKSSVIGRKPSSKMLLSNSREKERVLPIICRYLGRRRVAMLLLVGLALLVFIGGSFTVSKESTSPDGKGPSDRAPFNFTRVFDKIRAPPPPSPQPPIPPVNSAAVNGNSSHPCHKFALPPPPPSGGRRIGPRPCPVCYISVDQARASMPSSLTESPILHNLTYVVNENPIKTEPHGGSDFGGYPSLKQRNDSFDIRESMEVHCGFVKGGKPGRHTGFDIDEADLVELEQFHEVIVASAIFGNYDIVQQPKNISEAARRSVPFYMFIDEETEAYMRNASVLDSSMRVGLWRIIVVHNIPYADARRNGKRYDKLSGNIFQGDLVEKVLGPIRETGREYIFGSIIVSYDEFHQVESISHSGKPISLEKLERSFASTVVQSGIVVPKLLLHRIFPHVRYSIWIDGKLQLVVDPYQVLERFLWRQNANFAISRHYRRFDVFEEAEANKAAGKYDNSSIDYQIEFYKKEGLTPYSEAKLPITSDVPEGCVIIREHVPITNLFTCLWFNEVDRFTSRDQLSFSTVRDKIMSKVDWSINMFLDCERRNFVIQAYHRDLLELMPPPAAAIVRRPPPLRRDSSSGRTPTRSSPRHVKDRKSGSRHHRKAGAGNRERRDIS